MNKIKWNGFKVTALIIICIISLISLILAIFLVDEYLIVYESDAELIVDETYFVKDQETVDETLLNVFVMVTNDGDRSCNSHVRAFIINRETNIAMDDTITDDVKIEGHSTNEADFQLTVPSDARYRIEILVFKDDMVTVKGVGYVDLSLDGSGGQDYRTTITDEPANEASLRTPFIGPAAIIAAIAACAVLFRRWRK